MQFLYILGEGGNMSPIPPKKSTKAPETSSIKILMNCQHGFRMFLESQGALNSTRAPSQSREIRHGTTCCRPPLVPTAGASTCVTARTVAERLVFSSKALAKGAGYGSRGEAPNSWRDSPHGSKLFKFKMDFWQTISDDQSGSS